MPATLAQDRRLDLVRPDLAAADFEGIAPAARYLKAERLVCTRPSAPIRNHPQADSEQMDELLFGESFSVVEEKDGWAFGQASRDRYVGYVEAHALDAPLDLPSHWVRALRTC
ncbi:MAG TPA: peptidoglycan endopeptidase, partial [Caulobacteraceae bacterium]|nr:peptidoglycan endopeptidase [Caulobacteraceae bacterium]